MAPHLQTAKVAMAMMAQESNKRGENMNQAQVTMAVVDHAVEELRRARETAEANLQKAIAGFREVFVGVPLETRGGPLLRQAWGVHQALEVVRSLDAALAQLETDRLPRKSAPLAA